MTTDPLLIAGILLWSLTHLMVAITPGLRSGLINRIGEGPYKGLFSLTLIAAIVLMVMGWKASSPVLIYSLPAGIKLVTMGLMWIALILFISARLPTDIKQILRHPQLTGAIVWAFAHLLSNGDSRSLWLFGGILIWAHLEIIFINRRDGAREKPAKAGVGKSLLPVIIGSLLFVGIAYIHPWLSGVAIMPSH